MRCQRRRHPVARRDNTHPQETVPPPEARIMLFSPQQTPHCMCELPVRQSRAGGVTVGQGGRSRAFVPEGGLRHPHAVPPEPWSWSPRRLPSSSSWEDVGPLRGAAAPSDLVVVVVNRVRGDTGNSERMVATCRLSEPRIGSFPQTCREGVGSREAPGPAGSAPPVPEAPADLGSGLTSPGRSRRPEVNGKALSEGGGVQRPDGKTQKPHNMSVCAVRSLPLPCSRTLFRGGPQPATAISRSTTAPPGLHVEAFGGSWPVTLCL
ncbi:hypothetical protein CB1_000880027 [Camelus ferus]|nr:hypothetical protein CB1_000880027 [Camelus ferus]